MILPEPRKVKPMLWKIKWRKRPTFEHACRRYVHRFTMEHVPAWAKEARPDGKYCAPQYRTDREWYDNTLFPGERGHMGSIADCYARNASWPMGMALDKPYAVV